MTETPVQPSKSFHHMLNESMKNSKNPEAEEFERNEAMKEQEEREIRTQKEKLEEERIARILHSRVMLRDAMGRYKGDGVETETPSPNAYSIQPHNPNGFTIQSKIDAKDRASVGPGPAAHVKRGSVRILGGKIGGKQAASKFVDKIPGPAEYSVATKINGGGVSMSGWQRAPVCKTSEPAKYNIVPVNDSPSYSLGKLFAKSYIPTPGPLDYNPNGSRKKAPSVTIGTGARTVVIKEMIKPAPNKYLPEVERSQVAASLKGRYTALKSLSLETPGPANYIIANSMHYGVQVGLAPKPLEVLITYKSGPTSYNPKIDFTHRNMPTYTLGKKAVNKKRIAKTPSPATYTLNDRFMKTNDSPKHSLKSRHPLPGDTSEQQTSPGPADYVALKPFVSTTVSQKARNEILMRKSLKPILENRDNIKSKTPGPSDYNTSGSRTPREGFSLGKRIDTLRQDTKPSPNAYTVRSESKNSIRMKGRNSPFVLVFPSNRVGTLRSMV